jgi:hypothetical protein
MESGPYDAIISCCNIKYATAAAHPHIRAAATNQMTTNAAVAVIIDEVFELARSFATPRHAAHRTNPTSLMTAVCLDYLPLLAPERRDGCRNIAVPLSR